MRGGRKSRDLYFNVFVARSDRRGARLGLAVSRRVAPMAAARNRIKRQARESFRHHRALLAELDVVVVAQSAAASAASAVLRTSLLGHWNKAKKLCKKY